MIKQILKPINYTIRYTTVKESFESIQILDKQDNEILWNYGYRFSNLSGLFKEIYGDQIDLFKPSPLLNLVKPKPE